MKRNKLYIISFAIILITFVLLGILKSSLFIDETYMYCMANGEMMPFCGNSNSIKGDSVVDKVITQEEFFDLVSAEDNKFDYAGVYRNHVNDVHPPLYAYILHTLSSLIGGGYSFGKYKALALDFVIYILTLCVLCKLCKRLFASDRIAVITLILYGLSTIGLSTAIMIRMYVLLTLLTVLLAYLTVLLLQTGKRYIYPLITIVIFLGLFTQYYFAIYAAILCAAVCLYLLISKKYKSLLCFMLFALAGVVCVYFAFPACIDHLFADKLVSGQNALDNLFNLTDNAAKLIYYLIMVAKHMLIAVIVGILALVLIIKNGKLKDIKNIFRENDSVWRALIIIVPAYISILIIGIISPVFAERYVYNISPIIVLTVSLAIYVLNKINIMKTFLSDKFAIMLLVLSLAALFVLRPSYVYLDYREYNDIIDEYADEPCVYFDNNSNVPLTHSLPQLMRFNDVFVTNNTNSEAMKDYFNSYGDPDEIIVFIDTDKEWSSGYDADKILEELSENTKYKNNEKLYSHVYIVSK